MQLTGAPGHAAPASYPYFPITSHSIHCGGQMEISLKDGLSLSELMCQFLSTSDPSLPDEEVQSAVNHLEVFSVIAPALWNERLELALCCLHATALGQPALPQYHTMNIPLDNSLPKNSHRKTRSYED